MRAGNMQRRDVFITAAHAGRRVDAVLSSLTPCVPHAELCRWLRKGFVRSNGHRLRAADRLGEGDLLQIPLWAEAPAGPAERPTPQLDPPDLRYRDDDLLVAYKPAGLASHPGIGHDQDSLSARLAAHVACAPGCRVGLAQRLDAGVSGLIPCGTHPAALKALMGPPHGAPIVKLYVALVVGELALRAGHIRLPLRNTDQPRGDVPKVVVDRVAGVAAHSQFAVARAARGRSLVVVRLHTGRTHQIRAHLRAIGHPILGDPRYGFAGDNERAWQTHGLARPLLHAGWLRVPHPMRPGEAVVVRAPVPEDFRAASAGLLGADDDVIDSDMVSALGVAGEVAAAVAAPSRGASRRSAWPRR
jgi:23S rRNA pseudouridine1911/1915/1917 synthase